MKTKKSCLHDSIRHVQLHRKNDAISWKTNVGPTDQLTGTPTAQLSDLWSYLHKTKKTSTDYGYFAKYSQTRVVDGFVGDFNFQLLNVISGKKRTFFWKMQPRHFGIVHFFLHKLKWALQQLERKEKK